MIRLRIGANFPAVKGLGVTSEFRATREPFSSCYICYQLLPVTTSHYQSLSVATSRYQCYQSLPVATSRFQLLPVATSRYQSLPLATSRYQSLPLATSRYQSLPVATSCYQSLPVATFATLLSSIWTRFPGPPIGFPSSTITISQTSLQNMSQSTAVAIPNSS